MLPFTVTVHCFNQVQVLYSHSKKKRKSALIIEGKFYLFMPTNFWDEQNAVEWQEHVYVKWTVWKEKIYHEFNVCVDTCTDAWYTFACERGPFANTKVI